MLNTNETSHADFFAAQVKANLRRELKAVEYPLRVPELLKRHEFVIAHESGHAAAALAYGRPVLGYYFGERSWWEQKLLHLFLNLEIKVRY